MKQKTSVILAAAVGAVLLGGVGSLAQHRFPRYPVPPQPRATVPDEHQPEQKPSPPKMNLTEMERESKELSQLAATIPGDVDLLKKGLLPKDVVVKLKRIEKLSKQLRGQVTP